MSPPVWLVRHAPVLKTGVAYGSFEIDLALDDEAAKERIVAAIAQAGLPRELSVLSSPLRRCRGPAELLACVLGVRCTLDPRLAEIDLGQFEGRSFAELERSEPVAYRRWLADWRNEAPPGGEPFPRFLARVASIHSELRALTRPTLVLTHAGVIRMLRHLSGGATIDEELTRPVDHLAPERLAR